ncbi:hypothetical protein [Deinococcus apachensis]|uniref:hypothetical protein n=1 Tax=Deinococcus apachensis TaxID=309886 RepID=UPI000369A937|nr:hypothetical protein [Deinococcus apachensis]
MTGGKKRPTYSTQELKERGWTPAMIRDLLGQHDAERPNEMRVGRRDRRLDAPMKLYFRDRVEHAEMSEVFARAQERARVAQDRAGKAQETRQARVEKQVAEYVEAYNLTLTPHPDAAGMTDHDPWRHHLSDLYQWELDHSHLLNGVRGKQRRDAENAAFEKHQAVVHALYERTPITALAAAASQGGEGR